MWTSGFSSTTEYGVTFTTVLSSSVRPPLFTTIRVFKRKEALRRGAGSIWETPSTLRPAPRRHRSSHRMVEGALCPQGDRVRPNKTRGPRNTRARRRQSKTCNVVRGITHVHRNSREREWEQTEPRCQQAATGQKNSGGLARDPNPTSQESTGTVKTDHRLTTQK